MKKSVIEFENHFENKTTLVFQYNNKKYIINGCQIFLEENKEKVFYSYSVEEKYKNDVNEALALLNDNVNEGDLIYIVETYPDFIEFIKHVDQTYEMALIVVKKWGYYLKYVCEDIQDYEMALTAVKERDGNIKYIREDLQTEEMVLIVVKDWGYNLQYVREDLQTEELCKIALKCSLYNIRYIKCPVMKKKFENN